MKPYTISKSSFRCASTKEKLTGISVLSTMRNILKKINVSFMVLVDTASILKLFEHISYQSQNLTTEK